MVSSSPTLRPSLAAAEWDIRKVFDPFFTTKEVGKGTGLGLSMVYGFIKQSEGHIKIYSEVGVGTSFKLYLPCSGQAVEQASPPRNASLPRGDERILVVEDEPQVRASMIDQLRSLGYSVSEAGDARSGIAAFETVTGAYALLMTDVVLPGLVNGKALADEVTRRWPKTIVVFMSGFAERSVAHNRRIEENALLLSKPFRKAELAQMVRRALDAGAVQMPVASIGAMSRAEPGLPERERVDRADRGKPKRRSGV